MDLDLMFTLGIGLGVLSLPAIVSALIDGRAPRTAGYLLIIGGLLAGYAVLQKPGTYGVEQIPDIVARTFARYTQ